MIITKRVDISSLFFGFPNTPRTGRLTNRPAFYSPSLLSLSCFNTLYLLQLSSVQSLYIKSHPEERNHCFASQQQTATKKKGGGGICFERVVSVKGFCLPLTWTRAPSVWGLDPALFFLSAPFRIWRTPAPPPAPPRPRPAPTSSPLSARWGRRGRKGTKRREMLEFHISPRRWNQRLDRARSGPSRTATLK